MSTTQPAFFLASAEPDGRPGEESVKSPEWGFVRTQQVTLLRARDASTGKLGPQKMHAETGSGHRLVHLRFKPLWLYVDSVREFCDFFARATFEKEEVGQRVGLVVHELMENAIRYGDEQDLELCIERNADAIVVRVANTVSDERATGLSEVFAALHALAPAEAYTRALQDVAHRAPHESGLGLARVRYEGQVDLELQITPGRVCITARGKT